MARDALFGKEEAAVAAAEEALEDEYLNGAGRAAFEGLLKDYRKLFKTTKRLVRISDRNERDLAEMAEQQRLAAEEINRKNSELEALSVKLSKYLSPQVYDSIFTGRQDVRLASERKKLTIFFSDIEGFTETTDKMESEDLTQLINQYLTEMSGVALAHGATIDKYIGDAIMIFFGDPETRGVAEDALACVEMAIAMQERMNELANVWRESGVENPLRIRIGIHTGYCTVGNFGSNDRMDYTIIGGAVNLASRLEHEAEPGDILISYETHALIRHNISCEEQGSLKVKGLAYPVTSYRVLERAADLGHQVQPITADLPHLAVQADPAKMTVQERGAAAAYLRGLADSIDA